MNISKKKEKRSWSGQKYSQGSEVSKLGQVSILDYWYVVEPQIPTRKNDRNKNMMLNGAGVIAID